MPAGDFVKIGRVIKPFGYKGELKILLDIEIEEGFPWEAFFIFNKNTYLPYFITEVKTLARPEHIIVKLEDLDTKEDVMPLVGKDIFLRAGDIEMEDESTWSSIIGYMAIDKNIGTLGKIEDIFEMPQHEVAQVFYKEKEVLLPLNEPIIVAIDEEKQEVFFQLPDGLLNIYLDE